MVRPVLKVFCLLRESATSISLIHVHAASLTKKIPQTGTYHKLFPTLLTFIFFMIFVFIMSQNKQMIIRINILQTTQSLAT